MKKKISINFQKLFKIFLPDSKPLFAIAKQQQLEPISSKQIKNFKDFMFPSETTDTTETRIKQVDTEKSGDFVFPSEYKESTDAKPIFFNFSKTRKFILSTKPAVITESTTVESIPEKKLVTLDFVFPPDLTSPKHTNYNNSLVDNRINIACALTLCWGKK